MATLAGRIAEQGLKLLNDEIAAEAWSLESFSRSISSTFSRSSAWRRAWRR